MLLCLCLVLSGVASASRQDAPVWHQTTQWDIEPSLKYDALCTFDILSGDPYYRPMYRAEFARWWPQLTVREKAAFAEVKYHLKDEQGGIPCATLALYFSAIPGDTLDDMVDAAEHPAAMYASLKASGYYERGEAQHFDESRDAIITGLLALRRIGFESYWQHSVAPRIAARARAVGPTLERYNIVPEIEQQLGHPLPGSRVAIYLLEYSKPHGIRVTGMRLLTHESYPWDYTVRNAVHELLHPPFQRSNPAVYAAEDELGRDPLLSRIIAHHNASFGYNNPHGYVEEDCVQAVEQVIEEDLHVAQSAGPYWRDQDEGMHVLAMAIYAELKHDRSAGLETTPFEPWLLSAVAGGRLTGSDLRNAAASVVGEAWLDQRWGSGTGGGGGVSPQYRRR